jgi:hypothetical protein
MVLQSIVVLRAGHLLRVLDILGSNIGSEIGSREFSSVSKVPQDRLQGNNLNISQNLPHTHILTSTSIVTLQFDDI